MVDLSDKDGHHSTKTFSTSSMLYTLGINLGLFVFFIFFFEANRHYKQIFLKRMQKRFIKAGRVPPEPPDYTLGWLVAIWRVSEIGRYDAERKSVLLVVSRSL